MASILRETLPTLYGRRARRRTIRKGLARAERVAWWMEESVKLPIIGRRIGFDAIMGLFPGLGDLTSAVLSLYPVIEAIHIGAPRRLVGRMLANIAADFVLGLVPFVGDIADAFFKANVRNVALLRRHFGAI